MPGGTSSAAGTKQGMEVPLGVPSAYKPRARASVSPRTSTKPRLLMLPQPGRSEGVSSAAPLPTPSRSSELMAAYPPPLQTLGRKQNANNFGNSSCLAWQAGYCSYTANAWMAQTCLEWKQAVPSSPATASVSSQLEAHQEGLFGMKLPPKAPQTNGVGENLLQMPSYPHSNPSLHPNRAALGIFLPKGSKFLAQGRRNDGAKPKSRTTSSSECLEKFSGTKATQRQQSKVKMWG